MKRYLGAHMSIAGGYYKAVDAAAACSMNCVQLFTKNNNQWKAKPIDAAEVEAFRAALSKHSVSHPLSHASYLINLASPDDALRQQSIDAMQIELERATQLGIPFVVLHPGSFTTSSEAEGIQKVIESLDELHQRTDSSGAQILLENTAGQGSNLGWRCEQLGAMIDGVKSPERLGVCFDTCHAFAAGYPLQTAEEYQATMAEFDRAVGLKKIKAFHLNDSKGGLGSRKDRHEHIGQGTLGLEPFRHLLNDKRFAKVPMYLETPKGELDGEDLDQINLNALLALSEK